MFIETPILLLRGFTSVVNYWVRLFVFYQYFYTCDVLKSFFWPIHFILSYIPCFK